MFRQCSIRRLNVLLGSVLALSVRPVWPCATLETDYQAPPVKIVNEEAIIVWDAKNQTEHFIRRASFQTGRRDFGFIVPTPSVPELAEANDEAFWHLANLTKPEVVVKTRQNWRLGSFFVRGASEESATVTTYAETGSASPGTTSSVEVLSEQKVAGYDATTLSANNSRALNRWLKRHGYVSRPEFEDWLKPYIGKGWKITAFKVQKSGDTQNAGTGTVRMSFRTPRPFFPYREPANQRSQANQQERTLRVFVLSTQRMNGRIGENKSWPGQIKWSSDRKASDIKMANSALALPGASIPGWMTMFEDNASPRPGTDDLFFAPDARQSAVLPPPIIRYRDVDRVIPLELVLLTLGGAIFWWWNRPPRKRSYEK